MERGFRHTDFHLAEITVQRKHLAVHCHILRHRVSSNHNRVGAVHTAGILGVEGGCRCSACAGIADGGQIDSLCVIKKHVCCSGGKIGFDDFHDAAGNGHRLIPVFLCFGIPVALRKKEAEQQHHKSQNDG
ncbi:hypothetical protein D3C75_1022870 [compost metagenome]